jgi:general secretion pathway protein D
MNAKRLVLSLILFSLVNMPVSSQQMKRMEFVDQPIVDILMALSSASNISIIPDETVSGSATFYFSDSDFNEALDAFLSTYKLYCKKEQTVYYISRIFTNYDRAQNSVTLKADNIDIQLLLRALSKTLGKTILYDPLPAMAISVNAENMAPDRIVDLLAKKLTDFKVEKDESLYYIKKIPPQPVIQTVQPPPVEKKEPIVKKDGELYSVGLSKGKFIDVLTELFAVSGHEFSLLTRFDLILESFYFKEKTFNQLLRLLLEQGNADYLLADNVYYIFDVQKRDITKKYRPSIVFPLQYLAAQDTVNMLPFDTSSGIVKAERTTNSLILTGSEEEIGPILTFLKNIDRPLNGFTYYRFDMKYLKARDILSLIPAKIAPITPILVPESNAFVALLSDTGKQQLEDFLTLIDKKAGGYPVYLKYIKADELIKNLPPSVVRDDIVESVSPSLVFFTGTEEKRKTFLREIGIIDRPKPQIRYELLVIQYNRGKGSEFSRPKAEFGVSADAPGLSLSGDLSSLLSLSFDVVSTFGYQFALSLNYSLSSSLAQVFADTTLNGLSGQEIKFQNTDTFRYREVETDPDTGKLTYTGVSREITSGLIMSINGWVSGDGMITMQVNATVSKRGSDTTSTTGNPPTTSEKVVTTNVRTMSGKPVIIGGLLQKNIDISSSKVPFFGDIPLIGFLFRSRKETEENTEMVLYIVPHVTYDEKADEDSVGRQIESYYRTFVERFIK